MNDLRTKRLVATMLSALEGLKPILDTAESNASGNPEWEYVSKRVNAAREAIALASGSTVPMVSL